MAYIKNINKKGYWINYINARIAKRKNFICIITGETGSGKTYAALSLGEILDPHFDMKNVCFNSTEFLNLVDEKTKKMNRGAVILWEEMQIDMSNLNFQSRVSKMVNYILTTFRHQGFVLLITVPHFGLLNKTSKMLAHSMWKTDRIDYSRNVCIIKPYVLKMPNDMTAELHRNWFVTRDGSPVTTLELPKPSKELIKQYELKKNEFSQQLRDKVRTEFEEVKTNKKDALGLTEIQRKMIDLFNKKLKREEVAVEIGLSVGSITQYLRKIKEKGIDVRPRDVNDATAGYEIRLPSEDKKIES